MQFLAKQRETPFAANTIIIAIGINAAKVLSLSINIFFTAGSKSHAIEEVVPATIAEKKSAEKTYILNS